MDQEAKFEIDLKQLIQLLTPTITTYTFVENKPVPYNYFSQSHFSMFETNVLDSRELEKDSHSHA